MMQMAGVAGFEPAHGDTKNRCLTAWLHPSIKHGLTKKWIAMRRIFALTSPKGLQGMLLSKLV